MCNCGRSQLDGAFILNTLIRRLKLKDKRTESYNMNKKQNYTNEIQLIRNHGKDILTL